MSGYINGKVEVWYGDNPPSNQNVLWQKRIINNNVESTIMYEFNNNTGLWQVHNSNALANYAPINNAEFTGTLKLNGVDIPTSDLNGTNYVMVYGVGTPSENAIELQDAYDLACTMTPGSGNRIAVIVAPGEYTFGESKFGPDTAYVDIVSLTGNADVLLDGIAVTANNIYIKGISTGSEQFGIDDDLSGLVCENCVGLGVGSFGTGLIVSGKFINCTGGEQSFGYSGDASGEFINCIGGNNSFGGDNGIASGEFLYCTGGENSFGGSAGTASGVFKYCIADISSYGVTSTSAKFYYCKGTGGDNPSGLINGAVHLYCIEDDLALSNT